MNADFFARDSVTVARDLIGARLFVDGVGGRIVETEAYAPSDPASHSFRGITPRNAVMFGPPGRAYIYRIYGLHWCLNFVCGAEGDASAVLIRAIEPEDGIETMIARRSVSMKTRLCAGPGRLAQALGVDGGFNGAWLDREPFDLRERGADVVTVTGPRIGIRVGLDYQWRFGLADSPFLSRNFTQPASPL